tara:strand:- start:2030 stop:2356 length:327 start_codon:yes stop_codon:yes gene_type:complete
LTEDWFDEELWDDNFGDFDNEDLREIIDEAVTDIADLVQGLRSSDSEQVAKNSHKVVSTCGNFGYVQCAALAANIEQQAKMGSIVNEEKELLIGMVERVIEELGQKVN